MSYMLKSRTKNGVREVSWGTSGGPWHTVDSETGLPEVGEDQFWRVTPPTTASDHYMWVELRQHNPPEEKKTWRGTKVKRSSTALGSAVINVNDTDFCAESVLESAAYIMGKVTEDFSRKNLINKLAGEYPPKKFGL